MSSPEANPKMDPALLSAMQEVSAFIDGGFFAGQQYSAIRFVAHGETGVVWQVKNRYGDILAAKFTPIEFLDGAEPVDELRRRRGLHPPLFTRAVDADTWTHEPTGVQFAVIVEEWVDGVTLEQFLEEQSASIECRTILEFVGQFANVLDALDANDLAHDDLHARNILIRELEAGEVGYRAGIPHYQLVIVDTGSLKPVQTTKKDWTDHHHIAYHVARMHNAVHRRRTLTLPDRRFLAEVRMLMTFLSEDDADRALRTGVALRERFEEAHTRSMFGGTRDEQVMNEPFEFISAEQISSDKLLLDLFARTSWLKKATSNDPLLLTGPRGCGKSMVLRWMSLRAHAERSEQTVPLNELNVAGIYVSCTADFQNRFAELQSEESVEASRAEIIHYFNLVHLREVIATLLTLEMREDRVRVYGLGEAQSSAVADFVARYLPPSGGIAFANRPLRSAMSTVESAIFASQMRLHTRQTAVESRTSLTFLGDFTTFLVKTMPFFRTHRIAFLLDDFSVHRLSAAVQRVLLPVVWERRSSHLFKVSSEKHGTVDDFQGGELTIDLARERVEVDCGSEFLNDTKQRNEEFARDLLINRLRAADWVGTPDELIGGSPSLKETAKVLAETGSSRGAYHGMGTIAGLCSGDVSTLLLVFRHVLADRTADSHERVSDGAQHDAIVEVSRRMLKVVMHHRPLGKQLHKHGVAFGTFVRRMLTSAAQDGSATAPLQIPRLEVDNDSEAESALSDEQTRLSRELLRRAVFIEMDAGRSRHGMVTTLRWHFRRIYLPSFMAGLGKDEAVKTNAAGFIHFLDEPEAFLRRVADDRGRASDDRVRDYGARPLELWEEGEDAHANY